MNGYYDCGGNMTERDWDEVDRSSRGILQCFLETRLSATEIGESRGNVCWDLSCVVNGRRVAVEVKDRSFPHDRYGDILVESVKQECTSRRIGNDQFDAALAVNVFADGTLAVANMYDKEAKHFKKRAPATTLVKGADRGYVLKDFASLPQRYVFGFTRAEGGYVFKKL